MSRTDHPRPRRAWGHPAPQYPDSAPRYQHRPHPRRTTTRAGAVLRHLREFR